MRLLEQLAYIYELAASDRLDAFLTEHGVPDFGDEPILPGPRKFGSRPAFDRSSFGMKAYSAEIESHFKR